MMPIKEHDLPLAVFTARPCVAVRDKDRLEEHANDGINLVYKATVTKLRRICPVF